MNYFNMFNKTYLYIIILFSFLSYSLYANDQKIVNQCNNNITVCNQEILPLMSLKLRQEKDLLISNYQYKDMNEIDQEKMDNDFELYLSHLNELRSCQQQLGQNQSRCSIRITSRKKLNDYFKEEEIVAETYRMNNSCVRSAPLSMKMIYNINNDLIAQSVRNMWNISKKTSCQTHSSPHEETERSFTLSGYDSSRNKKGKITIVDWTITHEYKVGQHWGRSANLNNARLSYRTDGNNLIYSWENGASITLDGSTGSIIDSNILDPISHEETNCKTNITTSRGKVRFYPQIRLKPPYENSIRVSTIRG